MTDWGCDSHLRARSTVRLKASCVQCSRKPKYHTGDVEENSTIEVKGLLWQWFRKLKSIVHPSSLPLIVEGSYSNTMCLSDLESRPDLSF